MRLGHIVNRHCILGNDLPHLVDFILKVGDIIVISFNRVFCLIILLLQHLLLSRDALQLLRKTFGGGFELLPFGDELL